MHSEKMTLRKVMRDRLATMTNEERKAASQTLAAQIVEMQLWQDAELIGLFSGRADEMDTEFLWPAAEQKSICYPRVEGGELRFYRVKSPSFLLKGAWGLLEPPGSLEEHPDFLLVPGLAFDADGGRLGRGKGYYDLWLARNPRTVTLGICFDFQIVARVPVEIHDARVDGVMSEKAFYPTK